MPNITRRQFLRLGVLAPFFAAGCQTSGPSICGYKLGADALYDPCIKTVYVRTFENRAFQTTPYRGFERDVTKAVVDEIQRVTPYKVTSDINAADTELIGVIVSIQKQIMNRTQQNTIREGELQVSVDVVWRDLRDGTILSAPRKPRTPGTPAPPSPTDPQPIPFDPNCPVPPPIPEAPQLVPNRIFATGRYIMELGETNASALAQVRNHIAVQIVSMMEKKW
jgi:hypothetical protein